MKLSIHSESRPWDLETAIWIVGEDAAGNRFIAKPMELCFIPQEAGASAQPTMVFRGSMAREFFPAFHQAMIESGYLKPKKDESIEAIKYHLEDMRRLVFEGKGGK